MFKNISIDDFLQNYWQKKPILLKPKFKINTTPSPDELAGMSLDGVQSRIVLGNYIQNNWQIHTQPFAENIYSTLPNKDWTLLVQGVDRYEINIHLMIDSFNFIPRWKFDDVMISYATTGGSVGPHFDYYDVFLVQTSGKRKWQLSSKNCLDTNYNQNFPLKIMNQFESEVEYITEVGDILYIPPKIAHFGVSLDDNCTTASFGYRAYSGSELADFSDNAIKQNGFYQDPIWQTTKQPALITKDAIKQANKLAVISDSEFAEFVTKTDLNDEEIFQDNYQIQPEGKKYILNPCLKIAYLTDKRVFIAGIEFDYPEDEVDIMLDFCNKREIANKHKGSYSLQKLLKLGYLLVI